MFCHGSAPFPVARAKAGGHPRLSMPPQPVESGPNRRTRREDRGGGEGQVLHPAAPILRPQFGPVPEEVERLAFPVAPAKAGAHLRLSMPPQPAESGLDR